MDICETIALTFTAEEEAVVLGSYDLFCDGSIWYDELLQFAYEPISEYEGIRTGKIVPLFLLYLLYCGPT